MDDLIEQARAAVMSAADRELQKRSFAYGTTHIENEDVTRDMIDAAADGQREGPREDDDEDEADRFSR